MANTLKFKRGLVGTIPTAALGEPLFTTDTFDLYIGNGTGNTRFQKYIASGTTSQLLRGDGSLLTMPIVLTSPANGEVLKYNGTNWVNSSDAGITGSGVTGQVAYFTGATTQSGSNNLFWDATNNRLGIGTNTPGYSLHIKSGNITTLKLDNDNSRYVQLLFERNTVANTGADFLLDGTNGTFSIRTLATFPLIFSTAVTTGNSAERMRLTTSGNVIINNPSTDNGLRFQVTGDGYFSGHLGVGNTAPSTFPAANNLVIGSGSSNSALTLYSSTSDYGSVNFGDGIGAAQYRGYITYNHSTDAFSFGTSATTQATLNASGNLGLGVTPSAWRSTERALQIGTYTSVTDVFGYSTFGNNYFVNASSQYIFLNSARASVYSQNAGVHAWSTSTTSGTAGNAITFTQAMTLDASGRLGIGTASPVVALDVRGEVAIAYNATYGLRFYNDARNNWSSIGNTITGSTDSNLVFKTATGVMTYTGLGRLIIGSAADTSELLQVNGTMRVSGAATFSSTAYTQAVFNGTNTSDWGNNIAFQAQGTTFGFVGSLGSLVGSTTKDMTIWSTAGNGFRVYTNGFNLRLQIDSAGAATFSTSVTAGGFNGGNSVSKDKVLVYDSGTNNQYGLGISSGLLDIYTSSTGGITFNKRSGATFTETIRIHGTGNMTIGGTTTTDSGELLQVNGTMRVSGASTFGGIIDAASAGTEIKLRFLGYNSAYGGIYSNTGFSNSYNSVRIFNNANSSMSAQGNVSLPSWEIDLGGNTPDVDSFLIKRSPAGSYSFSNLLNIASTGAATFSSSVTAGGRVRITSGSDEGTQLNLWADAGGNTFLAGYNFTINTGANNSRTTAMTISNTSAATFSSTIQAATAIAIGTTPDTNLPFKILKNINSTVGIRFENTSTGASSFTGYQFGTDVSGGTAFTNFLYASSGVAETGVYKPNGTALINTGSGGLNFLAVSQPIRFFTSTGTGTLRAAITNDGDFTQYNGTNPSASTTDAFRMYSADITAGNAAPHFRTENGGIIKLYQQTTGVTSATYIGGAGTGLTDSDTFDGYTIAQIVKALRNAGLLA